MVYKANAVLFWGKYSGIFDKYNHISGKYSVVVVFGGVVFVVVYVVTSWSWESFRATRK